MATIYSNTLVTEATTTRTNLSQNPRMVVTGAYPGANYATVTITKNVAVPAPHPLGITTCAESKNTLADSGVLLSIYGADGRINTGSVQRTMGIYVYVNEAGYQVTASGGWSATPLTANTWTWVKQTTATAAGAFVSLAVTKITGNVSTTARAYVTGAIAEAGTVAPVDYFDGSITDADGIFYDWTGTVNASTSTSKTSAFTPQIITGWTTDQNSRNVVHEIIGKASPDVTILPGSTRSGSVETVFTTQADAENARLVLSNGTTFTIKDSETWNNGYTFVTNGTIKQELEDVTRDLWTVTFDYTEITA